MTKVVEETVYRILNSAKEKGLVKIIPFKGTAHFDADIFPHVHFICEKCGKIEDVFDVCSKCNVLKNKKLKVGKINYYKIYFYGICKKCKKQ